MSFYSKYIDFTKAEYIKNPIGFFTPYRNINDFARYLPEPIITPIGFSVIAALDAIAAAFYLAKGLVQVVTLHEEAKSTFEQLGDHFSGFILAATAAIISPFLVFAVLCTRSVASCIPSNENVPSSSLTL